MYIFDKWYVKLVKINSTDAGINPYLVNDDLNLVVQIPSKYLTIFGYKSNGPQLGITGSDTKIDIDIQKDTLLLIISEELSKSIKRIDYTDIRYHLKNYKGKKIRGEYKTPSKSTLDAIEKTLDVLEYDYSGMVNDKIKGLKKV